MSETPDLRLGELLSAAADDQLDAAERAELAAGLPDDAVAAELAVLATLKRRIHALAAEPLPPSLLARVTAALDQADAAPTGAGPETAAAPRGPRAARPPLRPLHRLGLAWAAVGAVAVAALLVTPPLVHNASKLVAHSRGETLELQPSLLAARHGDYHRVMAASSAARPPEQMAAELSRNVGFAVRPPDLTALDARMVGCATCTHSVPSGRPVALFVMESSGRPLTLFEVPSRRVRVLATDFSPQPGTDVRMARVGTTELALRHESDLDTVLAATGVSREELMRMAQHAVRTATAPRSTATLVSWNH